MPIFLLLQVSAAQSEDLSFPFVWVYVKRMRKGPIFDLHSCKTRFPVKGDWKAKQMEQKINDWPEDFEEDR